MKNMIIYNFYRGSLDPDGILYHCCIIAIPKKSSNVYCRIAGNHELEKVQKPRFTTMCIKDIVSIYISCWGPRNANGR